MRNPSWGSNVKVIVTDFLFETPVRIPGPLPRTCSPLFLLNRQDNTKHHIKRNIRPFYPSCFVRQSFTSRHPSAFSFAVLLSFPPLSECLASLFTCRIRPRCAILYTYELYLLLCLQRAAACHSKFQTARVWRPRASSSFLVTVRPSSLLTRTSQTAHSWCCQATYYMSLTSS